MLFAGTSFLQSPLSADYEVLRDFLPDLEPSYLPQGGTAYRAMLTVATKAFGQTGDGDRFLVVLSDGEAHDDQWKPMISTLQRRGIQVISLGVGTADGVVVPDGKGGVLKDEQGAVVLSRLEPSTLQELATETGGTYRDAAVWVDIPELLNVTVEQGHQGRYVEERHIRLRDQYQWFLAPAILFFLLSYWIEFPVYAVARVLRRRWSRKRAVPAGAVAAAVLLAVFCSAPRDAAAVPGPEPGPEPEPNVVEKTVGELIARPQLVAGDYAELAQHTIDFASQSEAIEGEPRLGVIDDALAGVDLGESLDPDAADWPTLREQLEQLKQLKEEPPPPEQQQDPPPEQDQQCDGGGDQDQQQQSQGGGGGDSSQNENDEQQNQGGSSGDQQQESQGGESGQDNAENQQSADGEQPNNESENQNESDSPANDGGDNEQSSGQESRDQAETDGNQGDQAGAQNGNDEQANPQPAGEQPRQEQASGGEVERQDVSPLEAAEAGFGELEAMDQQEAGMAAAEAGDEPAEAQPDTRLVGGGGALEGVPQDNVALAVAAGTMERIKDGDFPSVLFDRMNRAEKPKPPEKSGKNW